MTWRISDPRKAPLARDSGSLEFDGRDGASRRLDPCSLLGFPVRPDHNRRWYGVSLPGFGFEFPTWQGARLVFRADGEGPSFRGNFFKSTGKSNRAWKFSTVELLVKVIQSAPSSMRRAAAPVRSAVSGTVAVDGDVVDDASQIFKRPSGNFWGRHFRRGRRQILRFFDSLS